MIEIAVIALELSDAFDLDLFLLISKEFEPFRQKTLRPKLTHAEGFILGVGAKMFTIAGAVIVYDVSVSVVCGVSIRDGVGSPKNKENRPVIVSQTGFHGNSD